MSAIKPGRNRDTPEAAARRMRHLFPPEEMDIARAWARKATRSHIHHEISHMSIVEWATMKRILPQGLTSMPGPWRWEVVPYLKEIAECLDPTSPIHEIYVMKGAQIGYTVGVLENWIGYSIDQDPGPMMFISADADVAEESVELRVDRMIESAGIRNKVFSQSRQGSGKKTGDTKRKKEFPGGFLIAVGPNSGSKLRSFSIQKLAEDEMDAWPQQVGSADGAGKRAAEGDPHSLARRRLDAFEAVSKTLGGSTPLIRSTSRIEPLFNDGDQRRYFVPCKACGAMQYLRWAQVKYKTDDSGRLIWDSVHYECEACGAEWRNEDKAYFLPRGEWRPTAQARKRNYRSYHIPSLLSPIGMRSWHSICQEWIDAHDDPNRLRVFTNTVLGETWQERGEAPRWERIMLRREGWSPEVFHFDGQGNPIDYTPPILPEGALLLTLGADVQKDRIECEVVAWGAGRESWSLGYHVLMGETLDLDSPAWRAFSQILAADHGGMSISLALIDSHYQTQTVYGFCENYDTGVLPCMGESHYSKTLKVFQLREVSGRMIRRADIYTDILKIEIYTSLGKGKPDAGPLPRGYCHFPEERGEDYFRMLTAEERIPEKMHNGQTRYIFKKPEGRRNEALDCRVYSLAALYMLAWDVAPVDEDSGAVDWDVFWVACGAPSKGERPAEQG